MFPKKLGLTVHIVKLIRFTRLLYTRLGNAELWRRVSVLTHGKRKVTVDRSIRFNVSLPRLRRSRRLGISVKCVVTCGTAWASGSENW